MARRHYNKRVTMVLKTMAKTTGIEAAAAALDGAGAGAAASAVAASVAGVAGGGGLAGEGGGGCGAGGGGAADARSFQARLRTKQCANGCSRRSLRPCQHVMPQLWTRATVSSSIA